MRIDVNLSALAADVEEIVDAPPKKASAESEPPATPAPSPQQGKGAGKSATKQDQLDKTMQATLLAKLQGTGTQTPQSAMLTDEVKPDVADDLGASNGGSPQPKPFDPQKPPPGFPSAGLPGNGDDIVSAKNGEEVAQQLKKASKDGDINQVLGALDPAQVKAMQEKLNGLPPSQSSALLKAMIKGGASSKYLATLPADVRVGYIKAEKNSVTKNSADASGVGKVLASFNNDPKDVNKAFSCFFDNNKKDINAGEPAKGTAPKEFTAVLKANNAQNFSAIVNAAAKTTNPAIKAQVFQQAATAFTANDGFVLQDPKNFKQLGLAIQEYDEKDHKLDALTNLLVSDPKGEPEGVVGYLANLDLQSPSPQKAVALQDYAIAMSDAGKTNQLTSILGTFRADATSSQGASNLGYYVAALTLANNKQVNQANAQGSAQASATNSTIGLQAQILSQISNASWALSIGGPEGTAVAVGINAINLLSQWHTQYATYQPKSAEPRDDTLSTLAQTGWTATNPLDMPYQTTYLRTMGK